MSNKFLQKLRTPRIKSLCPHPTKPLLVIALYDGTAMLYSTTDMKPLNTFRVSELPIRTCAFYKHQMLFGCDDGNLYIYENEKCISTTQVHKDFIRKIVVRGNYIVTCSDDSTIKVWRYAEPLQLVSVFTGHSHFVMDLSFIDDNQFLSASLDSTVKLWHVNGKSEMLTMAGHSDGVNSVLSSDRYIFSVSDDLTTKIWDNHKCIYTIRGHSKNINKIKVFDGAFITCSEDGYIKIYNKKTWALENSINVGLERVWDVEKKDDKLFIACDEGLAVLSYGREFLHATISGNKVFVCMNENLKIYKGDLTEKDLSFLDFVPSFVKTQGKFIALGFNNEFFIYNVLGFRYRYKGNGDDFFFIENGYSVRNNDQLNFYDETNSITETFYLPGVKKLVGIRDNVYFCVNMLEGNATCFYRKEECIFRLDGLYENCVFFEDFVVFIGKEILVYRFDYEIMTDYIDQGISCLETNDHYSLIKRIPKKINLFYLMGDILFFTTGTKLNYLYLSETPFEYQLCTIDGRFIGVLDNEIFYLDGKLCKKPIDMNFIQWQLRVVSGSDDLQIDESIRHKAVDFLIYLSKYEEALKMSNDVNIKFDLLLKLKRFEEAKKHCSTPQHHKTLMKIFIESEDFDQAAECALLARDFTSLYALNAITGSYEDKIRNGCNSRSLEFWNEFNAQNYKKCAQLLQGSLFYDVFIESWMDIEL